MSFELNTQNIQINESIKSANIRTVVDTDVIVPDSKPDVLNVLQINALSSVTEKYIQKDHITVSGMIDYTILYSGDEEKVSVKSINFRTPFSQQIEVSGVEDDMFNYVKSEVRHIEYYIQNSRKINVKAVVALDTNVVNSGVAPVVSGISADAALPVKNDVIKSFNLAVCSENSFEVEDTLKLPGANPTIDDILKSDIRLESRELKVVNNKAVAKGNLIINTLYTYDEDIYYMENEVPFTEIIDVEGINPDMHSDIEYSVTDAMFTVEKDENGDNSEVYVKIRINSLIRAYEDEQFDVVSDVYSPDYELTVQKKSLNITEIVDAVNTTLTVTDSITVKDNMPEMVKIYNLIAKPYVESTSVQGDYAVIEGYINVQLLYLSDSDTSPVYCVSKDIPFTQRCETSGDAKGAAVSASVRTEHAGYSFKSGTEAEVRVALHLDANVVRENSVEVITDIQINEDALIDKKSQPGIIIYFAEASDTLWDIAKRYNTTISEIASINKIGEDEMLHSRQQLLIPKRCVV